jgi:hypothetical protein
METLKINGVDFTNRWASASSLPSTVDGGYYIYYRGNYDWSHFEAKGACSGGPTQTPVISTPSPTPTPTSETPPPGVGDVSMSPSTVNAGEGTDFSFQIRVNSGNQRVAAYGIDITYDTNLISIGSEDDVVEGADGFVSAVNINTPGLIRTSGFDTSGTGPGSSLHLLTVNMSADNVGTSAIGISVDTLADNNTDTIGTPRGIGGEVVVGTGGTPTPTPPPGIGDVLMSPSTVNANEGSNFSFQIRVNSGSQRVAAYGIDINYDAGLISIGSEDDVVEGADGFVSAVNINTPGVIRTSGFDTSGTGPGSDLHLVTVNMMADNPGTSSIDIAVDTLADNDTNTIGTPRGIGGEVIVETGGTPTPTPTTTPTPTPTQIDGGGSVFMSPSSVTVNIGETASFQIRVNSGSQQVAAYGIDITYDENLLSVTEDDVVEGSDGFISAVNVNNPGVIRTSGFDTSGVGPGSNLHLLTINMAANATAGTSQIGITVDSLADPDTNTIGTPSGQGGTITINDISTATPTSAVTETPTPTPTATPAVTETPTPTPVQRTAGSVWIDPVSQSVSVGSSVVFEVHCHTGNQDLAAYGIDIYYNSGVLAINSDDDVEEGADGFIAAVNINTVGKIVTSGFDTGGEGPGNDLHLLTVTMQAIGSGTSSLDVDVRSLADSDTNIVGNPNGISGSITVF